MADSAFGDRAAPAAASIFLQRRRPRDWESHAEDQVEALHKEMVAGTAIQTKELESADQKRTSASSQSSLESRPPSVGDLHAASGRDSLVVDAVSRAFETVEATLTA